MTPKVLVFGWYNHGNLGDEFFGDIFKELFPLYEFTFADHIDENNLKDKDAIFLGGGSFLDQTTTITNAAIPILKSKPIFYMGVGTEIDISPIHLELLKIAKLIVVRSTQKLDLIKSLNSNVVVIPDLVYFHSLTSKNISTTSKKKSVLILPNIATLPQNHEPHWKHMAWEYFKFEFAQFLDSLVDANYQIKFFPMCQERNLDDNWAAIEILGKMRRRSRNFLLEKRTETLDETIQLFSQYETVITQRYHGIVLADLAGVPHITISHHDKLKNSDKNYISFYGFNKDVMKEKFNDGKVIKFSNVLPIEADIFVGIKKVINDLLIG